LQRTSPKGIVNECSIGDLNRVTPEKSVELRMKNYEQLRYLQQLLDDKILTDSEYTEQKQAILTSLRKL